MKNLQFHALTILFISIIGLSACSKDREPKLIVTVEDIDGNVIKGATVHVWTDIDVDSSQVYNELIDQTEMTDETGKAEFSFDNTVVLDVHAKYTLVTNSTSIDLEGQVLANVKTVRQRSKDNIFNETVIIK